ncbi:MAG: cytosine permease [Halanaerobiales bacterium]|nr:cytosine permease [Halanaerobiales bacterium]
MKNNVAQDHDFALQPVPAQERRGFWSMLAVMLGFTFFSASMWAGGTLGTGLNLWPNFIIAILLGNLLLGIYTALLGSVASETGLSTHLLARYAFGEKGSYLASFLLSATQIGWFGVGVAMFALPIHKATGINQILLLACGGLLMTLTAYFGFRALTILSIIAVPSITILGSISVFKAINLSGGLQPLLTMEPTTALGFGTALTITVGSFISGGTLTPDFVRFAKNKRIGVSTTIIAFLIGNSLMFIFGAVGAAATGKADISEVMLLQGLVIPAIILLGLNIWTTNDNALYASGLGFSNITKIAKNKLVLVNGVLGTLASLWLYNNFVNWLTFLGSTLPPIGAIILTDYFIIKKKQYADYKTAKFDQFNLKALAAWSFSVLLTKVLPGIPPLNAVLSAMIIYLALEYFENLVGKKNLSAKN